MAAIDTILAPQGPQSVYLFPTPTGGINRPPSFIAQSETLFFQYWPQSLNDDYQVNYAEHAIPGGSHPLYQWVGGQGRTITFEAVFTSEINTDRFGTFAAGAGGVTGRSSVANAVGTSLLPSSLYTVDVAAALAKIRSWMMPSYGAGGRLGETDPPKMLTLVFPKTGLGGSGSADMITVILRSAPITYESWFPDGQPRVATVNLTFNEVVQTASGSGQAKTTKINFIGRDAFENAGQKYRFRGLPDRPFLGA